MRLLAPLALLLAAIALVACGGDDSAVKGGKEVSSDDPGKILAQTFTNDAKIESGKVDLKFHLDVSGVPASSSSVNPPIDLTLSGPFQSLGKGKVPKLDLAFAFKFTDANKKAQTIDAGATSTGDKGFVNFRGQDYALDDATFKQLQDSLKDPSAQSPLDLKALGLTPQDWLQDPQVDDGSSVGDTDTVKVSGSVDVPKLLADVNTFLSKAGSLGIPNAGQLPSELTAEQISQVEKAVKSSSVEIETGKDDSILRRMAFKLGIEDPAGSGGKADLDFEISLTELGEDQSVEAPSDTKPITELVSQLGGLGGLGGIGGGASSGGASGVDQEAVQKYSQCLQKAGGDKDKQQKCSELINP